MENGSIGASDAATLALLYGGGGGGYGGYGRGGGIGVGYGGGGYGGGGMLYPGNSVLAAEAHANGTSVKEAIDCNSKFSAASAQGMMQAFENGNRQQQFFELSREHTDLERRLNDQNAAAIATQNDVRSEVAACCCETQKSIAEAAKEAAKCCCDAQLQQCKDTADLKALIISENAETRNQMRGDALAAANAKIIQLETINALDKGHR